MGNKSKKRTLSFAVLGLCVLLLLAYVFFRSSALILGPRITIESPKNGEIFDNSFITITGIAKNTSAITLGGRRVFLTSDGRFEEQLVLSPGYTIISMSGEDKFGKTTESSVTVFLNKSPDTLEIQPVTFPTPTENTLEEL